MATTAMADPSAAAAPTDGGATTTTTSSNGGPIFVDTQHDDMVHDAQLDYYGCKLATSSSDRTVKIYDVAGSSYTHTATLQGHEGPVWEVSWAHPKFGVVLASCSFDGSVLIHRESRPHDWTLLHGARNLHESSVNGVAFAPHEFGLIAAAASSDGRVSFLTHRDDDSWGVEYVRDNALGVNSVSWSPYIVSSSGDEGDGGDATPTTPRLRLVTGGCDNRIRFYAKSPATGQWEEETTPIETSSLSHSDWVRDVAWAPAVVPGIDVVASCSEDKSVLVWTQKADEGEGGEPGPWKPTLLHTFEEPVWRLSWSVTGNILAVSSGDSTVTLWKAGLDGTWSQVDTVDDVGATGGAGGAGVAPQPGAPPIQQPQGY
eukprot:CAMPEP_0185726956 /NCGR_PEP_ID=MMETSP1171-20130828/2780_1 /TAXON_ID=374046 /ORGANISM="Helicotheca tamensis, Strain CCMP826" /LENGTH=372 /DNA_ID=CAMNT_0028395407 /DNA_START=18 /DNA_END=1136 /DNA_ORIENTATION=-